MTVWTSLHRRISGLGKLGLFLIQVLRALPSPAARAGTLPGQIVHIGSRSMSLMIVAGVCVGAMLSVQFFDTLSRFGSPSMLGAAVALSLVRELGPVLAALIVLGRAGSTLSAEIAGMRGSQQIDALICMAIDPVAYLLVPRFVACLLCLPLLTALFDVAGLAGGALVSVLSFSGSANLFIDSAASGVGTDDLQMGFIKSLVFAGLIGWICLGKGYLSAALRGTEEVSRVSADAVVIASIAILGTDYLLSALMS